MTDYDRFIRLCNFILGALIGFLIAVPMLPLLNSPLGGGVLLLVSTVLGGAVGKKRGASRAFLYFALVAALVLSSVISSSLFA